MRRLAAAQLANSIGDGAFYVTSALYFTRVVGLSATQVGLGLTIAWAVGFTAGVPLGHLADRYGPRRLALLLALTTAGAITVFQFTHGLLAFILAACLYTSCQCGLTAARQALLAGLVEPAHRTEARAGIQAAVNGGLALGAGLGGLALYFDVTAAYMAVFAIDAVSFLVCALILRPLPEVRSTPSAGPKLAVLRDKPYALLSFLNMIMLLHVPLITLAIPLWIVQRTDAPRWMVSALLVINTITVVLFQIRVARKVVDLKSAARSSRFAGVMLLAACVVFALTGIGLSAWVATAVLIVAALLQTVGEMAQSAGAWQISFDLAPPDKHGQYQGLFGNGLAVARVIAPLLLTTLILAWGMPGWIVLGGVFLVTSLVIGPAVRWAERSRATNAGNALDAETTVVV
ncbi:MFS transporter [Actinocrispum wychmicini]|uniref:Na+/melibiose symporter-like transporter n=1 Tax=Actinocrispum wychmicini TaxID=1213861 RepID=A0A4R2K3X1_9PSEU|nr:MFS transporter [Actinocrispum wychmicini]TCO61015.1 Na+/melibiose symporter-like transporter [Actinocrispum wychmicini]